MWKNRIQQNVTLTSYHFVDLLTWCYLKQVDEGEIALDWLLEAQRRAKELDKGIVHQYLRWKLDARRRHFLTQVSEFSWPYHHFFNPLVIPEISHWGLMANNPE